MEMCANVKLREAVSSEYEYEWQVVSLDPFFPGYIVFRSNVRYDCVEWLHDNMCNTDTTLKRVRVNTRGKLTDAARLALEFIVGRDGKSRKIECIKAARTIFGLGLKEAKELVEDYLDTL